MTINKDISYKIIVRFFVTYRGLTGSLQSNSKIFLLEVRAKSAYAKTSSILIAFLKDISKRK